MILLAVSAVNTLLDKIYTNYSIAYVGKRFSEAFKDWNYDFCSDVTDAINTVSTRYTGRTCSLVMTFVSSRRFGKISIILKCDINWTLLRNVELKSNNERIRLGLPSVPPTTFGSMPHVNTSKSPSFSNHYTVHKAVNYIPLKKVYYDGYRIGYNPSTRKYNILDKNGKPKSSVPLMKVIFFRKPFGKQNVIAHVNVNGNLWAYSTNGKFYDCGRTWKSMYLDKNESMQRIINRIITEVLNRYLGRELLRA